MNDHILYLILHNLHELKRWKTKLSLFVVLTCVLLTPSVVDPGFPRDGGANAPGVWGCQHMILPKFPENCIKLKVFGYPGSRPLHSLGSPIGPIYLTYISPSV